MNWIGVDVGKVHCQICEISSTGEIWEARVPTQTERLKATFQARPEARVLLESATESNGLRASSKGSATRSSLRTQTTRRCTATGVVGSRPIDAMPAPSRKPAGSAHIEPRTAPAIRAVTSVRSLRSVKISSAPGRDGFS